MNARSGRSLVVAAAIVVGGCTSAPDAAAPSEPADPPSSPAAVAAGPGSRGEVLERIAGGEFVNGWPTTTRNDAGLYSWDGYTCGPVPLATCIAGGVDRPTCGSSERDSCTAGHRGGFIRNGYGSGDVEIVLRADPEGGVPDGGAAVSVAGNDGSYRRVDARRERWIVDIAGITMFIRVNAKPGTSRSDLADAHAIVASMRAEPRDTYPGFRLVFILANDRWDSG